jgi:UDP-GlcNAc:undecaprenyl-phosphate GlcNAc-1-phosphate transferase
MSSNLLYFLFFIFFSLIVSSLLTGLTITISTKTGFVNHPNPVVKSHKAPVPYGGGIAIGLTIILIMLLSDSIVSGPKFIIYIVPVILIGMIDDILTLSPFKKLIAEILSLVPFYVYLNPSLYYLIIFFLFLLSVQNAWNLIDIMDGLTAGVSVITFLAFGIITLFDKRLEFYSFLSFITAFSTLGIRKWNKYPAKIFLGDTGSLLLGSMFGFMVIGVFLISQVKAGFLLLLSGIPMFELCFLVIIRIKKGLPFYKKSPDHFALRMLDSGFSIPKINRQVILVSVIHSVIVIVLSLFGVPYINLAAGYAITITGVVLAFQYFKNIPSKLIVP